MTLYKTLNISRLHCPIEYSHEELFFSLVDYRNNYFTSDDPNKIIEFYNSFENRDQLIHWMKERPKGTANIHEVEGDKEIIVVIPTADFNGKYAMECRENIFRGLHMVFVESGGKEDFYFNYAHNCNVGIKKAMEYDPKWIVVSNDDMRMIDPPSVLRTEIMRHSENSEYVLFCSIESSYHSKFVYLSPRTLRRQIILSLSGGLNKIKLELEKKFMVNFVFGVNSGVHSLITKTIVSFKYTGSFAAFSRVLFELNPELLFESFHHLKNRSIGRYST